MGSKGYLTILNLHLFLWIAKLTCHVRVQLANTMHYIVCYPGGQHPGRIVSMLSKYTIKSVY